MTTPPVPAGLRLAIFGTGAMSRALAPHWVRPGRALSVSGRTPARAAALADALDAPVLDWRAAAEAAEVVFLGVHWDGVDDVLGLAGADDGTLAGKVIVDCGNAVEVDGFTLVGGDRSLARRVQDRTGGRVVKAFNLCHADVWHRVPDYDGRGLSALLAGDDPAAKELVAGLVTEVGAVPVDVGGLPQAGYLEATAALVIRALFGGAPASTVLNLVDAR